VLGQQQDQQVIQQLDATMLSVTSFSHTNALPWCNLPPLNLYPCLWWNLVEVQTMLNEQNILFELHSAAVDQRKCTMLS
jgi:hypothetical protein